MSDSGDEKEQDVLFSLQFHVPFDRVVVDFAHGGAEVADRPEDVAFPVELAEVPGKFLPYDFRGPSFQPLDDRGDGVAQGNADVQVDVVLFHSERENPHVHFLADSFHERPEPRLDRLVERLSAVLRDPYEVVPAIEGGMGSFPVFHVAFSWKSHTLLLTA
jgi:hypothetical protein